ncbi:MAG: FAD-binding oxidoreductase [Pirellulales bacterium]|nr:FAD-binding oxidoreductase [Pirellulales bacterium]
MITTRESLPLIETVAPADQAAVAEVVRTARDQEKAIYPIGGGSALDYGVCPGVPGVGLSLKNLKRVVDHAVDDMTITVEAGVTMAQLSELLAAQRQRLPVDAVRPGQATIGGVVATGAFGPRRYACGTIRDYVLGLRAVDGQGSAFSAGGRVVKNAAGYDLCRLLVGSLGTLAVITQVTLMVRPQPETSAFLVADLLDFDQAERLLDGLVRTKTLPVAVELLTRRAQQGNPVLGPMVQQSAARLFVGFEGTAGEVEWMVDRLRDQWRELGIAAPIAVAASDAPALWQWLRESDGSAAEVQINVRPGATARLIENLVELDGACSIRAHAGNGVIRLGLPPREPEDFVMFLRGRLRPAVVAARGKMVVRSYPDDVELTAEDVWGPPGDGAAVMRAIKDRFDPDGILNRGRFVF